MCLTTAEFIPIVVKLCTDNFSRIEELLRGKDSTLEVTSHELQEATKLSYTTDTKDIQNCNIFIVTVPTPIDNHKNPDLTPLIGASTALGRVLKKEDIVIYESTVYPGATEEVCVPILEKESGMVFNQDFYCGYSPERINPGDKLHTVTNIKKLTSGSTEVVAEIIDKLYLSILKFKSNLILKKHCHYKYFFLPA